LESGVGLSRSWVLGCVPFSKVLIGPGRVSGAAGAGDALGEVEEPEPGDDCPEGPGVDPLLIEGDPFKGDIAPYLDVPPCHGATVAGCEVIGKGPGKLGGGSTVEVEEGVGEITVDAGAAPLHEAHPGRETAAGTTTP